MRLPRRRLFGLGALGVLVAACRGASEPRTSNQPPTPAPTTPEATTAPATTATDTRTSEPTSPPQSSVPSSEASPSPRARGEGRGEGPPALVRAALGNLSKTLHPYPDSAAYTQPWIDAAALIWGGADGGGALLAFDWDALDYRPAMATAMPKISADSRTFTFTLRDDLKWSDGSAITAEDFQFAYDQASREENRYVQLDLLQDIATVRTPDAHTVEIALKEPKPRDVALGIVNLVSPVPKHRWNGRSWTDTAANPEILSPTVVLGPFTIDEFRLADRAVFVPVGTYYGGIAAVPRVEILANQQPTVAYELLRTGRANWVHALPPAQHQEASANPDLQVKEWTAANAAYRTVEFNLTRPFLSDKRVRQALALALSRADLLDVAEQGLAVPQYSFVQPTNTRWVNDGVEKYDLDLGRARQLLLDAGYQLRSGQLVAKDGQAVKLQLLYPSSSTPRAKIAAYVQQQYKQLGIEVEVKSLDFNAYTDQVQNRHDFDISLAAYGGGSLDPDLGPRAQLITNGQQNVTGYTNPRVDELFKQAASELDEAKRKQLYDQIQVLVNADVPSHYLYALKAVDAFSRKVQGVTTHKGDRLDYNDALLRWTVTG